MTEKIKVSEHERSKPRGKAKPEAAPNRQGVQEREGGVQVLSSKPGSQEGAQRLSRREPGTLETQVEVAVHDDRGPDGAKRYKRII